MKTNIANSIFILGAGASVLAGAPVMKDFLDIAYNLWKLKYVENYQEDFERVFSGISALQAVHSKAQLDINNIESIFATFEMARILNKFPGKNEKQIDELINSLKRLIVRTIELTLRFPCENGHIGVPFPYYNFLKLVKFLIEEAKPKHKIVIITFNYDIAIDRAVEGFYNIDYGLTPQEDHDSLLVLKLHGSLN